MSRFSSVFMLYYFHLNFVKILLLNKQGLVKDVKFLFLTLRRFKMYKFARKIIALFFVIQASLFASECPRAEHEECYDAHMETFRVSHQELYFNQNDIFLNIEGVY